ncbi:flagellar hook-length control protein [Parvularcula bermudensis HTCC2503]|uniref:Flagellar hook-length control protein n=1 Tax=Parvularcula bermudensis (strain ATCC BAA-594 / HTCC2503 / KCTC 12087) TaxID=314260 RepID=E0TH55_PARBH|nr:flagellar hook-length control protein FliK [Parvularcula bermudensis]ADM09639.1 flagellar hook-length control protein [Parvularcula bermudensis HTCC2503]
MADLALLSLAPEKAATGRNTAPLSSSKESASPTKDGATFFNLVAESAQARDDAAPAQAESGTGRRDGQADMAASPLMTALPGDQSSPAAASSSEGRSLVQSPNDTTVAGVLRADALVGRVSTGTTSFGVSASGTGIEADGTTAKGTGETALSTDAAAKGNTAKGNTIPPALLAELTAASGRDPSLSQDRPFPPSKGQGASTLEATPNGLAQVRSALPTLPLSDAKGSTGTQSPTGLPADAVPDYKVTIVNRQTPTSLPTTTLPPSDLALNLTAQGRAALETKGVVDAPQSPGNAPLATATASALTTNKAAPVVSPHGQKAIDQAVGTVDPDPTALPPKASDGALPRSSVLLADTGNAPRSANSLSMPTAQGDTPELSAPAKSLSTDGQGPSRENIASSGDRPSMADSLVDKIVAKRTATETRPGVMPTVSESAFVSGSNVTHSAGTSSAPLTGGTPAAFAGLSLPAASPMSQAVFTGAAMPAPLAAQGPVAAQQVAEAMRNIRTENHISVRLDPPELGRVEIDLNFDGQKLISAVLSADEANTSHLLKKHLDTLQRELASAGFENVAVDIADRGSQQTLSQQAQFSSTLPSYGAIADSGSLPEAPSPLRPQILTIDRIDLRL